MLRRSASFIKRRDQDAGDHQLITRCGKV